MPVLHAHRISQTSTENSKGGIMTIRIRNDSTSAIVRGYALDSRNTIIWLELAPQHPKTIGAIWADLVQSQHPWLQLSDQDVAGSGRSVHGLGSRYARFTADAPDLALKNNARPRLLRLVAPAALKASEKELFYIFAWPSMDTACTLAAMLERDTGWPLRIEWGAYLLQTGLEAGFIKPLEIGGAAPQGYEVHPPDPDWGNLLAGGIQTGKIHIQ
jgi:hypothetical protein